MVSCDKLLIVKVTLGLDYLQIDIYNLNIFCKVPRASFFFDLFRVFFFSWEQDSL